MKRGMKTIHQLDKLLDKLGKIPPAIIKQTVCYGNLENLINFFLNVCQSQKHETFCMEILLNTENK